MRARSLLLSSTLAIAIPAQEVDPILARLPADATNVLLVRDPMPHVEAILGSPLLVEALRGTAELQRELLGMRFDAVGLRRQIGLFRNLVPTEVAITGSTRTFADLVQLCDVGAAAVLLPMLQGNGAGDADAAADLRAAAVAALRELGSVDLLVRVQARDERTADGWFERVADVVPQLPLGDGLEFVAEDARLTLRVRPLRCLDGELRQRLARAGVEVPADLDPELVVTLELRGAELELRLGAPAAGPLAAAALGPLWRPTSAQWLFAKLDPGAAAEAGQEFAERLFAVSEDLDRSFALRLLAFGNNVLDLLQPTTASLVVDRGFVMTKEAGIGEEAGVELDDPDPAVVRCVVPDDGPFVLSALPLDALLANTFDGIGQRLAQRGRAMDDEMAKALDFLDGDESSLFAPGVLVVTRAAGFRGAAGWRLGAMPFAAVAMVARANDAASARTFVTELTARLQQGFGIAGDVWRDADLGLGVPTQVLDLAVVHPGYGELGIDADFAPHWCVVGDVLVLSTDPALTAALVACIHGERAAALPVQRLVDWSSWPGPAWRATVDGLGKWFAAVRDGIGEDDPRFAMLGPVLEALTPLLATIASLETVTELDGDTLREITRLRLRGDK